MPFGVHWSWQITYGVRPKLSDEILLEHCASHFRATVRGYHHLRIFPELLAIGSDFIFLTFSGSGSGSSAWFGYGYCSSTAASVFIVYLSSCALWHLAYGDSAIIWLLWACDVLGSVPFEFVVRSSFSFVVPVVSLLNHSVISSFLATLGKTLPDRKSVPLDVVGGAIFSSGLFQGLRTYNCCILPPSISFLLYTSFLFTTFLPDALFCFSLIVNPVP